MKKILLIDTTFPINTRTVRFKNTLDKKYSTYVCAWKRDGKNNLISGSDSYYVYKSNIGFGNKLLKLIQLPLFVFFIMRAVVKLKPNILFASHWDSLLCAVLIKVFVIWRVKIVYDCLDMPTASNRLVRFLQRAVEKFNLNFVSLTVFASRYFKQLYPNKIKSYIYENHPSRAIVEVDPRNFPTWFLGFKFTEIKNRKNVSWIGVVRYFEIIQNILKSIVGTDIYFYVFGDGPELNNVKRAVSDLGISDQVIFFGRYEPTDLSFIYSVADIVWAAYPTTDFNAVYAISNKYFECSYFNKTPVFSQKTKMAGRLNGHENVLLVDEYSVSEIREKLIMFHHNKDSSYNKYEPDTTWEDRQRSFLEVFESIL